MVMCGRCFNSAMEPCPCIFCQCMWIRRGSGITSGFLRETLVENLQEICMVYLKETGALGITE